MKRPLSTREAKDGETSEVPFVGVKYIACCDCGLTHTHVYFVRKGKIIERVWRNNELTDAMRKRKVKAREIIADKKANAYVIVRKIDQRKKFRRIDMKYEPY